MKLRRRFRSIGVDVGAGTWLTAFTVESGTSTPFCRPTSISGECWMPTSDCTFVNSREYLQFSFSNLFGHDVAQFQQFRRILARWIPKRRSCSSPFLKPHRRAVEVAMWLRCHKNVVLNLCVSDKAISNWTEENWVIAFSAFEESTSPLKQSNV